MDEKVTQYMADVKNDFKGIIKIMVGLLICSLIINILVAGIFINDSKLQRNKFIETIDKQQSEFMSFMLESDFTVEYVDQNGTSDAGNITNQNKIDSIPENIIPKEVD